MRKISITDKLIIASIALSIVTIVIVASYSFYNTKNAILVRTFDQLTTVRAIKSNLIENFFKNSINELLLSTHASDVKKTVAYLDTLPDASGFRIVNFSENINQNSFLTQISKKGYCSIFIIGNNHNLFYIKNPALKDNKPLNYKAIWDSALSRNAICINDFNPLDSGFRANLTISSVISDSLKNPLGVMVFEITSDAIDSIMLERSASGGLGKSGETYLVGSDSLFRSSSRFKRNSALKKEVKTVAIVDAMNNHPGTRVINDYRGIKVLSSYSKLNLPWLNWIIVAEIDYEEATIPIYRIKNEIVFISIFIFLVVLIVASILAHKITYPIQKLSHAAHEVGSGNYDINLSRKANDEIGELTESFNKMVVKIKNQTSELELEKEKRMRSLLDGQENERQRLSRELHDGLGQLLIGLKLKYESCLINAGKRTESMVDLGTLFDKTIDETRRISNNLMPAALTEFGLTTAIRNICNDLSESSNINFVFTTNLSNPELDPMVQFYLFRIIQESATNIVKHSGAKNAFISLVFSSNKLTVIVSDDGKGFDSNNISPYQSNGLNNIKDRVYLLSGKIMIKSEELKGTHLNIEIPLKQQTNE